MTGNALYHKVLYHVFPATSGIDWFTENHDEAERVFYAYLQEYGDARLYEEAYESEESFEEGVPDKEDCLMSDSVPLVVRGIDSLSDAVQAKHRL